MALIIMCHLYITILKYMLPRISEMYCRGIFPLVIICVAGLENTLPYRKQNKDKNHQTLNSKTKTRPMHLTEHCFSSLQEI